MKNSIQLSNRLQEVLLDGKWIANTNYQLILADVTLSEATIKIADLNTIAMLTFHINYYLDGILNVFNGGELEIRDKYSFDLPELKSEADWEKLVSELMKNAEIFVKQVATFSNEKLAAPFVNEKYGTYQRNIEAVIEHSYYHLGQIVLIKKMIRNGNL
jgi:uncharacterized damage-inducible protein DinB